MSSGRVDRVIGAPHPRDKAQIVPISAGFAIVTGCGWRQGAVAPILVPMSALPRPIRAFVFAATLVAGLVAAALPAAAQEINLTAPNAAPDLIDRLRANSLLLRPTDAETARSGQDITAAARADYGRLIAILYEAGYFAPVISIRLDGREASGISPFSAPDQIDRVDISIETGAPFRLGQAQIGPLATGTTLPEDFRPGGPATTLLLRDTTRAALEAWQNLGHASADLSEQRITANHRAALLDVAIRLQPGPVIHFGTLLPEGQARMRPERILAIAGLPVGEVYSPKALAQAEDRLRDTGAFSSVALRLAEPRAGDVADVTALLDEAPLRRLGFGIELASDEGLRLSAYWLHRNLWGGAERLRFDLEVSGIDDITSGDGIDTEIAARFDRPATFGPDTSLSLEAVAVVLREPSFQIDGIGLKGRLTHRLSDRLRLDGGLGLSFSRIEDGFGRRDITRLTLPLGVTHDSRDNQIDARRGSFGAVTLTPFQVLGGSAGARLTVDGRGYWPLGAEARTRLAARVQLGTVAGGTLTDIPPDDLFFSGGSGTVRGQPYRNLGALQAGQPSGGRGFAGLSGELRHDIGDTRFGIVGFADAGYISEGAWGSGSADWHSGAGIGLRYTTPFGPIRVDLATPATGANAGQEFHLYIGIGQAF
jgi:translocation and assembly module TamA